MKMPHEGTKRRTVHSLRQTVPVPSCVKRSSPYSSNGYEAPFGPWRAFIRESQHDIRGSLMKKIAISAVSVVLLVSTSVWGNDQKLSLELKGRRSNGVVKVIVQYKVVPAQKHRDRIAAHGGLVKQHLHAVKGLLVIVP